MKVTRKIQTHVEAKIRHAIATGLLPRVVPSSTNETHSRQESTKTEAEQDGQAK